MCVAIWQGVMVLSEFAIIYLATAAPFGVSHFLKQSAEGARGLRALCESAAASFAWPATTLRFLFRSTKAWAGSAKAFNEADGNNEQKVEQVKRASVNALRAVEDLLGRANMPKSETKGYAFFAARASVERYAGLTLACLGAKEEDAPSKRELEMCRIAGRTGDDLLVAGRCIHRRNVARLLAHRELARAELVHALAAAGEAAHANISTARQIHSAEQTGGEVIRQISEALLDAYARIIELLSLFDDRAAVVGVTRLLDAECARLRRLEAWEDSAAPASARPKEGVGQCTTQTAHTAFATPRLPTTTSTGG